MFWCKHKYGKIDVHGVQSCLICGKARSIGCQHFWEDVESGIVSTQGVTHSKIIISKCKNCGKREKFVVGVHDVF